MSQSLRLRMPKYCNKIVVPAPPNRPPQMTTVLAPLLKLPQTLIAIAESPSHPKCKAAIRATPTTQPSKKRKRWSPSITDLDESMASTQYCLPDLSASSAPTRQKRCQKLKEQQIMTKSIISTIRKTADQNRETQTSHFQVGTLAPDQPYPTQYYISPNYGFAMSFAMIFMISLYPRLSTFCLANRHCGFWTRMTVRKEECSSNSDTDWS